MGKKAEELANERYPIVPLEVPETTPSGEILNNDKVLDDFRISIQSFSANTGFIEGYEVAEKDVWDRIEKYLSNRNPTDYATAGWILKNIEEYKKKIMEEEL